MTLIGKIFRPWDLSSNETFVSSKSNSKHVDKEELLGDSDIAPTPTTTKSTCSKPPAIISPVSNGTSSDGGGGVSRDGFGDKLPHSPINSANLATSSPGRSPVVYPGSYLEASMSHHHHHHMPYSYNNIPSSPVGTQTCSSSSSTSFMTTSSINELASLTRTELTAMGLLPPEPPASMKVKRQRPKRFRCPHCQVAFSNNGQLRGHIRIHTGERPFACEHEGCGKSFTRNEELTRHRRIHTGLRPYPCTHCGKKFGRKDHLKKHTRTHQRPMYNTASSGMIGLGNPFHPFNPSLLPGHSTINEFASPSSPFALPFMLSIPPPISHFPFS